MSKTFWWVAHLTAKLWLALAIGIITMLVACAPAPAEPEPTPTMMPPLTELEQRIMPFVEATYQYHHMPHDEACIIAMMIGINLAMPHADQAETEAAVKNVMKYIGCWRN